MSTEAPEILLAHYLKTLKLPTFQREYQKLARQCAAEGVDLAHEVALADAADRRIAAHRPERLDGLRKEERAPAHPGRGECGLGAGVAATDHDDVEDFHRLQRLDAKPPLYGILRG